jgi:hypothetical protein
MFSFYYFRRYHYLCTHKYIEMEHRAGYVNIIDLILRGECPVDIRLKMLHFKNNSHA